MTFIQGMLQHGRNSRAAHHAQHVVQSPAGLGVDNDLRVAQIRNTGLDIVQHNGLCCGYLPLDVAQSQRVLIDDQFTTQMAQLRPGLLTSIQQIRRHIVVVDIVQLGRDQELPLARLFKWKIVQVAFDLEVDRAGLARFNGLVHVLARIMWNSQRQVPVHAGRLAIR